jgi:hypothetical protein
MDNLETALGTQDTERRQAKYKNYNRKSKTKKMSNTDPPKKTGGEPRCSNPKFKMSKYSMFCFVFHIY